MSIAVADLQSCVTNRLPDVGPDLQLAGIIGDTPSRHAKSPSLWNAAFRHFDIGAVFLAFDVAPGGLEAMVRALRANPRVAGFSVTAPYKVDVLPLLDEVEARAARIGAVNTVVRTPEGRLVGHNTDGQGALDSLTRTLPGATAPFFPDLAGRRVLLFGAGGAARAVSHFLAGPLADGSLWIANRHRDRADALCQSLSDLPVRARVVADAEVDTLLPQADLVVNCSTIGQAGVRAVGAGRATCLEPFSALAAAEPPAIETAQPGSDSALYRQVVELDRAALADNHARALDRCLLAGPETRFFDVVYAPLESVFLQHARWTGHPTLNGKGMNVAQAADGLFNQVFRRLFETRGLATDATYADLVRFLTTVW